ncbi:phage tail protein [Jiangella alkaliphila]|uniref:Conserved hypothetical phage tail region protein n=1 Tax=Jiangella alkaliphila TaxID=419479 RepID=A0A1H2K619_9ACTN|nr:phage tail protein [Jiangella alkaliphila]SDU63796.1 conserved hypothetical phage tail region protein [Jiangella alkaliphila]
MRKKTPVVWATVAAATAAVLSTSTPSVAQSTQAAQAAETAQEVVSYGLAIDGISLSMHQCVGIGTATEVVETRVPGPDGQVVTRKVPGHSRDHDLVCTRAVTDDDTLVEWQRLLLDGAPDARKDVTLTLFDLAGAPFAQVQYVNAWPSELTFVDAGDSSGVLLEVVTIVADGLVRVS